MGSFDAVLGRIWGNLGVFGDIWGRFGDVWGGFGVILIHLMPFWVILSDLRTLGGILRSFDAVLGPILDDFGDIWGGLEVIWGHFK